MNLVVFTEEPSMKVLLEQLLPSFVQFPDTFQIISHNGITMLKRSLPNKLKSWKTPDTKFLILVDQDKADCKQRKAEFEAICQQYKAAEDFSVRIVCQELEAWFLGDVDAVTKSGLTGCTSLERHRNKSVCMEPDLVDKPSRRLDEIIGGYQKVLGAKAISPHLNLDKNNSHSFGVFINTVREFCEPLN